MTKQDKRQEKIIFTKTRKKTSVGKQKKPKEKRLEVRGAEQMTIIKAWYRRC